MAFYIPPEYYGLNALGGAIGHVGEVIQEKKRYDEERADKDFMKDVEMAALLDQQFPGSGAGAKFLAEKYPGYGDATQGLETHVPLEVQQARAVAALPEGPRRERALGVPTEIEMERETLDIIERELAILDRRAAANPSAAEEIYSRASDRLKQRLGPLGVDLSPQQIQQIHVGKMVPGSDEFNTVVWGHPDGPSGLGEQVRAGDRLTEAKIGATEAGADADRARASYYRSGGGDDNKGKTLFEIATEERVKKLVANGVPNDVALKAVAGVKLSPEEQAVVDAADTKMQHIGGGRDTRPGSDLFIKIAEGELPTTFETEESARAYAEQYKRDYGVSSIVVPVEKKWYQIGGSDKFTLEFTSSDNIEPTVTAPEQQINRDAGKIEQAIGIAMDRTGLDRETVSAIITPYAAQHGAEAALAKARSLETDASVTPEEEPSVSPGETQAREPAKPAPKSEPRKATPVEQSRLVDQRKKEWQAASKELQEHIKKHGEGDDLSGLVSQRRQELRRKVKEKRDALVKAQRGEV